MPNYPQLVHLSVPELIGAAGDDPWQIDDTIQAGAPGEINELAGSFRAAGVCITETDDEFLQAKKRFDESWDRDDPAHPINDAEEVRRATQWLKLSKEQMAKVAADLQNIAAMLAEAQRSGHVSIGNLNARLVQIDNLIATEIARAQADGVQLDWSALKAAAIDATKGSLGEMTAVRDAYAPSWTRPSWTWPPTATTWTPSQAARAKAKRSAEDQARGAAGRYDEIQRAADEALVNSGGPMTAEMQAAAARLRDFGIVNDPNANPYAKQYAGERLNDYNMSRFVGPLPVDPVLGRDARQQAQSRLEFQQKLEAGAARVGADVPGCRDGLPRQLRDAGAVDGAQPRGAAAPRDGPVRPGRADGDQGAGVTVSDSVGTGVEQYGDSVETGRHALAGLSKADAELFSKWGNRVGWAGNIAQLVIAGIEYPEQRLEPQRGTGQGGRRRPRQHPRWSGRRRSRRLVRRPVHRRGCRRHRWAARRIRRFRHRRRPRLHVRPATL